AMKCSPQQPTTRAPSISLGHPSRAGLLLVPHDPPCWRGTRPRSARTCAASPEGSASLKRPPALASCCRFATYLLVASRTSPTWTSSPAYCPFCVICRSRRGANPYHGDRPVLGEEDGLWRTRRGQRRTCW